MVPRIYAVRNLPSCDGSELHAGLLLRLVVKVGIVILAPKSKMFASGARRSLPSHLSADLSQPSSTHSDSLSECTLS